MRYLITLFDYLLRRKQARLRRPELANVSSRCWQFACRLAQTGILHYKALHGWPQSVGLHRMAAHAFFCKAMSDHTLCGTQSTDGDLKMHMNNVHIAQCSWDTCQFEDNFILTMTPIIHISPSQNLI